MSNHFIPSFLDDFIYFSVWLDCNTWMYRYIKCYVDRVSSSWHWWSSMCWRNIWWVIIVWVMKSFIISCSCVLIFSLHFSKKSSIQIQHKFHWVGVFWNVISVVIVGATALLATGESGEEDGHATSSQTLLGVSLMMAGAFVQAVQFVFEEHVMKMDVPAPPLLLIGMEGFWGTFLSIFVMYPLAWVGHCEFGFCFDSFFIISSVYPLANVFLFLSFFLCFRYYMPGDDHGSYENPFNTWAMLMNSRNIQFAL